MARIDKLDVKALIKSLQGGLVVFKKELPSLTFSSSMTAPWRKEKEPSLRLFNNNGIIVYKDFGGDQTSGDCFNFLMKKYGITLFEAINMVKNNYKVDIRHEEPSFIEKEYVSIDFETKPFSTIHKKYWNQYYLPESYLNKKNVFAVKSWAINKKIQQMEKDVAVFVYWAKDIDKCKIMSIGESVTRKWVNSVPNDYLWNLPEKKVEQLFLIKSYKDLLCLDYHYGLDCVGVQNESAMTYLNFNVERVEEKSKNIIVLFGSDPQGVEQSKIIQKQRGYKYFNTPKYMYKYGIEDPADMIREFGILSLKNELVKKNFLK